ncbi:hypothetical protein AM218_02490 [Hymenobacter sp. DG25A]|nr:hypothetical protein AM218_02490 [Hymenobacter sp. DG25A]
MKTQWYKIAFGALLLALPLASCDSKLDIEPVTNVSPEKALKTSADVEALLNGGYEQLGGQYLYGGGLQYYADLLGDAGEVQFGGTYLQPKELIAKSVLTNNSFVANTWTSAYATINTVNTVLANLDKVSEVQKERVEGGAKFIRGALYFELVRYYGKAWNDGNPSANLGVPIVLTPTDVNKSPGEEAKVKRNTVAEGYEQAIKDLTEAETLLPATNGFFATKYAASAMLARLYLQQQEYAKAAVQADKVISSDNYALVYPYAAEFAALGNTSEDIFAIQLTPQAGINDLNTFYSINSRGEIYLTETFVNQFEPDDDRLNSIDYDYGLSTKFDNIHGNIHLIRLAEMYLIRAEGNLRAGTEVGASPVDDVNMVRERAQLQPYSSVTIDEILLERRLELAFEGFLLHDLKRTEMQVDNLPWNSPKLVLPIPQRETDVNSNLVQNEGY